MEGGGGGGGEEKRKGIFFSLRLLSFSLVSASLFSPDTLVTQAS